MLLSVRAALHNVCNGHEFFALGPLPPRVALLAMTGGYCNTISSVTETRRRRHQVSVHLLSLSQSLPSGPILNRKIANKTTATFVSFIHSLTLTIYSIIPRTKITTHKRSLPPTHSTEYIHIY